MTFMSDPGKLPFLLELDQLPDEGFILEGEENPSVFDLEGKEVSAPEKVFLKCRITKTRNGAVLDGTVSTVLKLDCSRCLQSFPFKIQSSIEAHFIPKSQEALEGNEVELASEDLDAYFFEGGVLDLRGPVRDNILLAVPIQPLCDSGCRGLCPVCHENLNKKKCACQPEEDIDPRLAVLKNLIHRKE